MYTQEKLDELTKEGKWTKSKMIGALGKQDLNVTFTKANGQTRKMICTLGDDTTIPEPEQDEYNKDSVIVIDKELNEYRRFRIASITRVTQ